jgi:hypothetical protein
MKLQDLIKENISSAGYKTGRIIRGKGIEIFTLDSLVFAEYVYGHTFSDEEITKIKARITEATKDNTDGFYIQYLEDSGYKEYPVNRAAISRISSQKVFYLYRRGVKLGYIKTSSYDRSFDSQCQLITDLKELDSYEVLEEQGFLTCQYDTFDGIREIESSQYSNYYCMGEGYECVHGDSFVYEDHDEAECINTRMDYYDDDVMNTFWWIDKNGNYCGGYKEMQDYIKELDPDEDITVYHRKGKDFYVTPSLNPEEHPLTWYDEDGEEMEEYIYYLCKKINLSKKLEEIVSVIKAEHQLLEVECCLQDKLENVSNEIIKKIMENEYSEDAWELKGNILDNIDWKSNESVSSIVGNAYEKFFAENLKEKKLFGKYTHLIKLENLALQDGKKLVYTRIGNFTENMSYAIEYKGEEYHFSLFELYSTTPADLYSILSDSLTKRLLEQYENSMLLKKAQNVFVGLEDSYNAGNCETGTKAFCDKHNIDTKKIGAIRGDFLLGLDFSSFTRRAVMGAINRNAA